MDGRGWRRPTGVLTTLLALLLAAGCAPTQRLLGPGQRRLTSVQLEGVKQADREELQTLFRQKPNSNFPVPKLAIYNLGYTFYDRERQRQKLAETQQEYNQRIQAVGNDSVKLGKLLQKRERRVQRLQRTIEEGNAIMRLGEPPVVYDSSLTNVTADQIRIYLRSKGFFRANVRPTDASDCKLGFIDRLLGAKNDTAGCRLVAVKYHVHEGPQFHLSQLTYSIADSAVARIVRADTANALVKVGQPYDESRIGLERNRLENLLKNRGYYDFRTQYISLEADTSFEPTTVRLRLLIDNPPEQAGHRAYQIRHVTVVTDAGTNRFGISRDTVQRAGVNYLAYDHRFSTRILDRKLQVRPGDMYSLTNSIRTQRQLADLDVFRFTGVNYYKVEPASDTARAQLDAVVQTSPQKKFQETSELGGTYVADKPGPFGNFRLRVRNVFGGAEVLDMGLRAGFEGQFRQASSGATPTSVYTTQLGVNANLIIPQFLVPWRTNQFFTNYSPRTRISLSYTYVSRPEYTRTNLEAAYDYIWQRSAYLQYVLTPINLSLVNTLRIDGDFANTLRDQANTGALLRSFDKLLIPSLNASLLYNSNDFIQTLDARYFRLFTEVGGLGSQLYTQQGTREVFGDTLAYRNNALLGNLLVPNYYRISADFRRYHKLSPNQFIAWRLNGGLVQAFSKTPYTKLQTVNQTLVETSFNDYIVPYDKYFFAGGSSSIRAWRPRRLGPGGYSSFVAELDAAGNPTGLPVFDSRGVPVVNENVEQPGDLLLEGSVEYRFPIYDYIKGAFFTDFGNVWLLQGRRADTYGFANSDGTFKLNNFYREIAVGSGLGLRLDFTFLIIRLDFAWKVYDPTAPRVNGYDDRFALRNFAFFPRSGKPWLNTPALNVGIGYPF